LIFFKNDLKKTEKDKNQLQDLFKTQIEDLDSNLKKLINENDEHLTTIKELRFKSQTLQTELNTANDINKELNVYINELKSELNKSKSNFERSINEKCSKLNHNDEKIKYLELELAKSNSKFDDVYFQLSEMKNNYAQQVAQNEMLTKSSQFKDELLAKQKSEFDDNLSQLNERV
jgi:chromosome segregation ATPase